MINPFAGKNPYESDAIAVMDSNFYWHATIHEILAFGIDALADDEEDKYPDLVWC